MMSFVETHLSGSLVADGRVKSWWTNLHIGILLIHSICTISHQSPTCFTWVLRCLFQLALPQPVSTHTDKTNPRGNQATYQESWYYSVLQPSQFHNWLLDYCTSLCWYRYSGSTRPYPSSFVSRQGATHRLTKHVLGNYERS